MAMRGALGVVALAALLWSSSGVFSALVTAISRAWCGDCGRPMWKEKLVGLILTLMAGLLIFVAIGSSSLAQVVHLYGDRLLPAELAARVGPFDLVGVALSIAVNISAFFILYKWVPALHVPWRPALLGAVVAGVVWEAAKGVFAWYLSTFAVRNFTQVYGPISAVLGLLLWTYVSAVIVLLGAELGATYVQSQNVIDSDQL
jgi:membrane protein